MRYGFILGAVLVAFAAAAPEASARAGKIFTVANYPVEATAENAVAAKDKAHAEGQQAALGALLKRIVPVTAYNRLDRLSTLRAADFIDGVAVRSETNSRTQYIASLDFSFQADAVRDLLHREGVPYVEQQAPRMVLVPVLAQPGGEGGARFRPAAGTWSQVWQGLDLDNTLTPLRVEALQPTIQDDTIAAALAGDDSVERTLAAAYNTDFVLLAVAEVDQPGRQLNVTLAGVDPAGLVTWRKSYRLADGDVAYAMEFAAVVTQGVLEGRWKVAKLEESGHGGGFASGGGRFAVGGGSEVRMAAHFASQAEWDDMRGRLLDLPGVDNMRIGAVSAQSAEVSLSYPGGGQSLASALARQGLILTDGGGFWALRSAY